MVLLILIIYFRLLDICGVASRHDLHKLIIASLDFAHDIFARVILEKLLTGGDEVCDSNQE